LCIAAGFGVNGGERLWRAYIKPPARQNVTGQQQALEDLKPYRLMLLAAPRFGHTVR
jgi:hypothetical protein